MNCPQCIAAVSGFLSAYWLTLSVSACIAGAALLFFIWYVRSGEWRDAEKSKHEMMEDDKNGISGKH